jgi:hypothetical protein
LWANHPPRIVPVEVSKELLEGTSYTLTEAFVGECVGNYTIGMYSCIDVNITFKGPATAPIIQLFLPSILLVTSRLGILTKNNRLHVTTSEIVFTKINGMFHKKASLLQQI